MIRYLAALTEQRDGLLLHELSVMSNHVNCIDYPVAMCTDGCRVP